MKAPTWFSRTCNSYSYLRSSFTMLAGVLGCLSPIALRAQTVTFTGTSPVNFGNVNLCATGKTTPEPCSETQTLTYKVTESGALGAIKVLTLASPNLDFTLADGTTCVGEIAAGTSCTVKVTFAPRYPGARPGVVVLADKNGKALATTPVLGSGVGPQIGFDPGVLLTLPYTFLEEVTPVLDGANDIFVAGIQEEGKSAADGKIFLEKLPVGGGAPISIPVTTGADIGDNLQVEGLAIDSIGDLFFTDGGGGYGGIGEIPAGGAQISLLTTGTNPYVDVANNLYVARYQNSAPNYSTIELPFGCQSIDCARTLPTFPYNTVVDIYGNGFYAVFNNDVNSPNYGMGQIFEAPASGGTPILLADVQNFPEVAGVDFLDNLYIATNTNGFEMPFGSTALVPISFNYENGFAVNGAGDIYFGEANGSYVVQELQRSLPPSLSYGTIAFGGTTPVLPLTIANTGTGTLTVSPSFSSPNFQIASMSPANCMAGIAAAQPCTLQVEFSPVTAGTHTDTLTLETNSLKNASVSLTGAAGAVATPVIYPPYGINSPGYYDVTISDVTPGTAIYYTTDGAMPTAASTLYTGPFNVFSTTRITAIAIVSGISSNIASSVLYIDPPFVPNFGVNYFLYADLHDIYNVMQFNGSTAQAASRLQLTDAPNEAGSAFLNFVMPIQTFTTYFPFRLLPSPGSDLISMADGFTFTIQTAGLTSLGGDGSGLGYAGIGKSVAIKFDLYDDGQEPSSTGLYTDGASPATASVNLAGSGIDLHSGNEMLAQIVYDGANLVLTITDTINQATWSHSFAVDIPSIVGGNSATLGFTGGTGAKAANQRIYSWAFYSVVPGPAPPLIAPALPTYPAGMIATGLTDNGNAGPFQTSLRLATGGAFEAGSAFYSKPLNVQAFTTDFTFQLAPSPTSGYTYMADGMTFTIQNAGVNALGGSASGLGYAGIGKSVAIKFDLHNNAGEGQDSTGLYIDGALPTVPSIDLTGTGIDLHSGDPFKAHLTYDGSNLSMTLTDTVTSAKWTHSFAIDIPNTVGGATAFVGFTGATGGATTIPQVLNWTFTNP